MSRNRNVRKVASYDDYDDYDDYDEEDYDEEDYAPEKGLDKRTQECLDTVHAYTGTDLKTTQQEIVDKIHAFDYDINAVVDWLFQKEDEMRAHAASRASQAKSHAQSAPKKTQPIAVKAPSAAKAPAPAAKAPVVSAKAPVAASLASSSSGSGLPLSSSAGAGSKPKKIVSQMSKQDREALMREIGEFKGKKTFNLAIVGHVDAGKSTLMGHLLRLLHVVNDREMHRNEHDSKAMGKGSFLYAWVLDTSEDEKERGITIDISKTYFETNTKSVAVLDSPGHRDFIPQMITAATQADSAILVLDSSVGGFESGISENGQTLEHAMIIRSFGVESVIVAVNKLDLSNWSQERFDFIVSQISPALSNAGLAVHFVPCSGMTGENLLKRTDPLLSSWYTGPTLIDLIDSLPTPPRQIEAPFRLCISNTFTSKNGLTVEGKIESGVVSLSNELSVYPSRELCSIRSIMVADEKKNWAVAGDNVVFILKGVEQLNVNIGNFLVDPEFPIPVVRVFEAKVLILSDRFAFHNGLVVQMQYQNVEIPATIKKILRTLNKKTGQAISRFPSVVRDKALVVVRIATAHTICIDKQSRNKHISRFALRKGGWTIGSGVVTRLAKPPRSSSSSSSSSSLPLSASHDHS